MAVNKQNIALATMREEKPFSFQKHSSIGCGGWASVGYFPRTEEELIGIVDGCLQSGMPYVVVGNMTNVLPPDGIVEKTVICTNKCQDVKLLDSGVYVGTGVTSTQLLRVCENACKTGAEFLEGIPCTVGGALYMNAGVAGAYIGDIVQSVKVYYRGETLFLRVEDCKYAYKSSVFMQDDFLILGACLHLSNENKTEILARKATYRERRAHLPKGKSMGCVFKNPQGAVAGKLIEGAGLKGLRIGGAKVAEEHANFIINENNATTADVTKLIGVIKNAVRIQYGIELQEEIRYLY